MDDGIEGALRQAREAAGKRNLRVAVGPTLIRRSLRAGLVDEFLLGSPRPVRRRPAPVRERGQSSIALAGTSPRQMSRTCAIPLRRNAIAQAARARRVPCGVRANAEGAWTLTPVSARAAASPTQAVPYQSHLVCAGHMLDRRATERQPPPASSTAPRRQHFPRREVSAPRQYVVAPQVTQPRFSADSSAALTLALRRRGEARSPAPTPLAGNGASAHS